jgi:fatty-acyl-CoA synthase
VSDRQSTVPTTASELVAGRRGDDNLGLRFEGRSWTWSEVVREMDGRARVVSALTGDGPPHIGVLLDNVPEYLFLIGGVAVAGAVLVGLNSTRRGEDLARDIRHTDCAVVLTDAEHRPLLDGLDLGPAGDHVIDVEGPGYAALLADAERTPDGEVSSPTPSADDLMLLLFTSGSTGAPKAVRATQGRVARAAAMTAGAYGSTDAMYCAMPLFHGNALMSSVFPAIGSGAALVVRRKFSASAVMDDIRAERCTFFSTVGRALSYVLAVPERDNDRDHNLRFVLAPESSPADVKAFQRRFGVMVVSGYGSSENAIVLVPKPGLPPDALGVPGDDSADIAVVDAETMVECPRATFDDGGRLTNGDVAIGEIVGRNALGRFEGYYNNPEATEARARNGWYWSGDLGYRDPDGVFFFAGRTNDWLRVDGENFAAVPVERVLARLPEVRGAVVIGVPDERTVDDQVLAVLEVEDPAAFDPDTFDRHLAADPELSTKWAPRYVRLVAQLPLTATNKIDRALLRATRWNVDDSMYWRPERKGPLVAMSQADRETLHAAFEANQRADVLRTRT